MGKSKSNARMKAREFFYLIDKELLTNNLDKIFPIKLKHNEELIERVHARYPFISKAEIALTITEIFAEMRKQLFIGNILKIHKLFSEADVLLSKTKPLMIGRVKFRLKPSGEIKDERYR